MPIYKLGVKRDLVARHFLVGGDWGQENELHSHHYVMELQLEGEQVDQHGFQNTGCESFARVLAERFRAELAPDRLTSITVKVWEDEASWASYCVACD